MTESLTLYSFFDGDRSGKVRWTAAELGIGVEEARVKPGEQYQPDYRKLNPYSQIPVAVIGGQPWIESTAICLMLAERHPSSGLLPDSQDERERFWQSAMLLTQTLEKPAVHYLLSQRGVVDERWSELLIGQLAPQLKAFAATLPEQGCLLGPSFRLVDIFAAYVLKIAVAAELLPGDGLLGAYMARLAERPAAAEARFFDS